MLSTKMKLALLAGRTILMAFACTASVSASSTDGILVGKWNHVRMVQTADGRVVRVQESHGESSLEFKKDGTWVLRSPRNNNSGTYRLMNGNLLESTTRQSDIPAQIGWHSVKQVKIDGTTLQTLTKYDDKAMEAFAPRSEGVYQILCKRVFV